MKRRTLRRWHQARRLAAAGLAGAAAWAALHVLAPPAPPTVPALVAATDLTVGHTLTEADVREQDVDPVLLPSGALTRGDLAGSTLGQAVGSGEILTSSRVRPARAYAGLGAGVRAVHVPVPDAGSLGMLRPGDRVDVHALADGAVVGSDLLVLGIDAAGQADDALSQADAPRGVVLAVPTTAARRLVPAAAPANPGGGVHLALRPGTP